MRGDGWRGSEEMEMDKMRRKREQKMRLGSRGDENYTTIYKSNQKPAFLCTQDLSVQRVLLMLWWICAMFTYNVGPCGLGGRAAALGCDLLR
jgi:lantibiotic modifying enzyme